MGDRVDVGGRSNWGDMGDKENQVILVLFQRYASVLGRSGGDLRMF